MGKALQCALWSAEDHTRGMVLWCALWSAEDHTWGIVLWYALWSAPNTLPTPCTGWAWHGHGQLVCGLLPVKGLVWEWPTRHE